LPGIVYKQARNGALLGKKKKKLSIDRGTLLSLAYLSTTVVIKRKKKIQKKGKKCLII